MFAAPPEIQTTVFSAVPQELRRTDELSPMLQRSRPGVKQGSFLEGPSFDRDGNLFLVDIAYGRILKLTPDAQWSVVADYDGQPNGLKFHKDGRIFVADHQNGIMEIDPVNGKVSTLLGRDDIAGYKGVNDLFFDSKGTLYFTDQGETGMHDPTGRLFRYELGGKLECLVDTVPSPNGLVMNPEETILYLAVTRGNAIWRVPLHPDGAVGRVGIFIQLTGSLGGPDGVAMDRAGSISVCQVGSGCVWLFSWLGEPLARIRSCEGLTITNLAYGGPDNKTIYITDSSNECILTADLEVAGQTMFSHMD